MKPAESSWLPAEEANIMASQLFTKDYNNNINFKPSPPFFGTALKRRNYPSVLVLCRRLRLPVTF